MRGHHDLELEFGEPAEERFGQGRAFGGVGRADDFVQQHQGVRRLAAGAGFDTLEQADEFSDVGGKTGQVFRQVLRIADVREGVLEKRHFRTVPAGQMEPAPHHQAAQAQQLQQHGLSAGIGPGNHQHRGIFFEHDVVGHHLLLGQRQQGMPGFPQANVPVRIETHRRAVHADAQARLGSDTIQGGQDVQQVPQVVQVLRDPRREFLQNPGDFTGNLQVGDFHLVVQVDEFTGFQKHRGAAGRHIMHDPGDVVLALGLDWQDVPVLPLGIVRFLQQLPVA